MTTDPKDKEMTKKCRKHQWDKGVYELLWCKKCGEPATLVFLTPPKLDWYGMAQGENAGPEFKDRFDRNHRRQAEKERKSWNENGDYGGDCVKTMDRQPGEPDL